MIAMLEEIGVDESTRETIGTELREGFGGMVGLFRSGADRETIRERISDMSREVLQRHLTSQQLEQVQTIQREREATRPGVVYSANPDGTLRAHNIRLGISDDRFTEVVSGDLEAGTELITRLRRTEPDA
jgi:HlyD family secretion protein